MPMERRFLGWDAPVTERVSEFLLPLELYGPVDLERNLVVVPTQQAGRRLRQSLSLYCSRGGTALLSPRVVTPVFFIYPEDVSARVASQTEVMAVWTELLVKIDPEKYRGLFPARIPERDFVWAMHTGEMIQRLRDVLMDGGHKISDVVKNFGDVIEELDRWQDMADLETAYLARLEELGRQDPVDLAIRSAENPKLPEGIERVVVAAVPDPTPLTVHALENLAKEVPIIVLIHAPDSLADHFDRWGRPLAGKWSEACIDIPDAEMNVILSESPCSQSHKVVELIAEESNHFGPADIAVGVPDGEVAPFLAAELEDKGLLTFDPAGKVLSEHSLCGFLDAFRALINEGNYLAFGAFLRHADVLDFLQKKHDVLPHRLLEELDKFQNQYLPVWLEDIVHRFAARQRNKGEGQQDFTHLERAVAFVREQMELFWNEDLVDAVRSLLQTVYAVRMLNSHDPGDEEFTEAAQLIDATLREFAGGVVNALGIEKKSALELLLQRLRHQRYYLERKEAIIDLEGWLELAWNDAPLLLITGVNEGIVPYSQMSDVFLPDTLRSELSLRHNADWLATDAYLMHGFIESRRENGRVCFIVGKTSNAGEMLKPSRLLFLCSGEELPHRAERLFGEPHENRQNYPSTISFQLEASPPRDVPAQRLTPAKMPVTWFRDYLACPFRFYLQHVLGMEEVDDEKSEMDVLDFGSLVHGVLERMAADDEMRRCGDEKQLRDFLHAEVERWAKERFGPSPPLQVAVQLDVVMQRLSAAACEQAGLVQSGWELMRSERNSEAEINGMMISGRIDRIDRHRDTGCIRILDYKTSDNAQGPEKIHIAGLPRGSWKDMRGRIGNTGKRWIDLQLPLYRFLFAGKETFPGKIELGYFNLPRSSSETGVVIWEGLSAELLESARTCAEEVVSDIQHYRFWPPATRVTYDDFQKLFYANVDDCINARAFEAFLQEQRR